MPGWGFGILIAVLVAALILPSCFGSPLEQQEKSYRSKLATLAELAGRSPPALRTQVEEKKRGFEAAHESMPVDAKAKGEVLGLLNQQLSAAIEGFAKTVAEAEKKARDTVRGERLASMVGEWHGTGMEMSIGAGGQIRYRNTKGTVSKSFEAAIQEISEHEFIAGALGIRTVFNVNEWPHQEDGKWIMTVDGTVLARSSRP